MAKKLTKQINTQECFKVVDSNGDTIRVYEYDVHGDRAEEYAKEYAGKIGAKVI